MTWYERANPENSGEGLDIEDPEDAEAVCRRHNHLYPRYRHKVVEAETNNNEK